MRLLFKQHGAPSSRRRSWSIDAYCGWNACSPRTIISKSESVEAM